MEPPEMERIDSATLTTLTTDASTNISRVASVTKRSKKAIAASFCPKSTKLPKETGPASRTENCNRNEPWPLQSLDTRSLAA